MGYFLKGVLGLSLFLVSWRAFSQVEISEETNYFDVSGGSKSAVVRSLTEARKMIPGQTEDYDARTNWDVQWNFSTVRNGDTCKIDQLNITAKIRVFLPQWIDQPNDGSAVEWWLHYVDLLRKHEAQHVKITREGVQQIYEGLSKLAPMPCEGVAAAINAKGQLGLDTIATNNLTLDEVTNHGISK